MSSQREKQKNVLIVGGGFAGLAAAKTLGRRARLSATLSVTLIDRRNYHLFQPLLYQVAMAGLSPAEIAAPIRSILARFRNVRVLLGSVEEVDLLNRRVKCSVGDLSYDYLILACGSTHGYFGHDAWEAHAPGLKSVEQATEIRRRVLLAFERAECESDLDLQKQWLTFVVIGGGPTGVELAGALGEISRYTLGKDFRRIDPRRTRVVLVEAGARLLSGFPEELSVRAARDLESLGVQIWTSTRVTSVDAEGVWFGSERIAARTVLWAAGVEACPLNPSLNVALDPAGRVPVGPDLSLPAYPEVFVIGDQASAMGADGRPLPGLAPVAMQQGRAVARNILADLAGRPRQNFRYLDKGTLATIGRRRAVGFINGFRFKGFVAWWIWLFVHVYYLIGFKNRLFVLYQWAWSYLTYRRGARLIVEKEWKK